MGATSLISYATLISTAHTLAKLLPKHNNSSEQLNILFVLFNGESYDYIGSQRFIYDVNKRAFPAKSTQTNPISLDNIEFMIDIGLLDDPSNILIYHNKEFDKATQFKRLFQKYNDKYFFNVTTTAKISENLPPTSAQSFLREHSLFPAIILNSKPENKFLHSIYDDDININYKYYNTSKNFTNLDQIINLQNFPHNSIQIVIRNVSTVLATTVYELLVGKPYSGDDGANVILVCNLYFIIIFMYC